ncbi:P2 family phage major capsid protein [Salmonella enterica]|nr:P2 family phage major capsid protein [Salmonella enterica]EHI9910500.1 P2 family phage major capsid protein [Salmonella enterica]EHJ0909976.1 P2 family phage major capsid protein [Salmonella enterica]
MIDAINKQHLKASVFSALESALTNTEEAERIILEARINNDYRNFDQTITPNLYPKDWFMSQINYKKVYYGQPHNFTIGDLGLSTGRAGEDRFIRESSLNNNKPEVYEFDTGEVINWSDLMNIQNLTSNLNLGIVLMRTLFNKLFIDDARIGFWGTHAGGLTDPKLYPNGEDVAPGWHEIARKESDGKQIVSDAVTIGNGGDFPNVDAAALHLINTRIPAAYRSDPRLVVMVGHELAAKERMRLFNTANGAGHIEAASAWGSTVAGKFAFIPPHMPGGRLCVTMLNNLHINIAADTFKPEFAVDDNNKRFRASALRYQGYGLTDVDLYAAFDESALTYI